VSAVSRPLFRIDAGWPFVIAGLALLVAVAVLPAKRGVHEMEGQLASLRDHEAYRFERLNAFTEFLELLEEGDPQLVRRLAASQLNLVPKGETPILLASSLDQTVPGWIDDTVEFRMTEIAPYPDTLLIRLAEGQWRVWLLGGSVFVIFIGLMLGPDMATPRRRGPRLLTSDVRPIGLLPAGVAASVGASAGTATIDAIGSDYRTQLQAETAGDETWSIEEFDRMAGSGAVAGPSVAELDAVVADWMECEEIETAEVGLSDEMTEELTGELTGALTGELTGELEVGELADGLEAELEESLETESLETESLETEALETESLETESLETESLETEALETKSLETESLETDALETEMVETEMVETDALETEMVETEALETEMVETEALETEMVETEAEAELEDELEDELEYELENELEGDVDSEPDLADSADAEVEAEVVFDDAPLELEELELETELEPEAELELNSEAHGETAGDLSDEIDAPTAVELDDRGSEARAEAAVQSPDVQSPDVQSPDVQSSTVQTSQVQTFASSPALRQRQDDPTDHAAVEARRIAAALFGELKDN